MKSLFLITSLFFTLTAMADSKPLFSFKCGDEASFVKLTVSGSIYDQESYYVSEIISSTNNFPLTWDSLNIPFKYKGFDNYFGAEMYETSLTSLGINIEKLTIGHRHLGQSIAFINKSFTRSNLKLCERSRF